MSPGLQAGDCAPTPMRERTQCDPACSTGRHVAPCPEGAGLILIATLSWVAKSATAARDAFDAMAGSGLALGLQPREVPARHFVRLPGSSAAAGVDVARGAPSPASPLACMVCRMCSISARTARMSGYER